MVIYFRRLLLAVLILLCLCPLARANEMDDAIKAYKELEDNAQVGRDPAAWRKTAALFDKASLGVGDGEARFYAGICFERASRLSADEKDITSALANYAKLFENFGKSEFADDGLFRTARLYENKGEFTKALSYYRLVVEKYPKGDMAELARVNMEKVGKEREINGIRHWSGPTYTRVVIELSALTPYEFKPIAENPGAGKPYRVVLDLKRTLVSNSCDECRLVDDGLVTQVRAGQFSKDVARVVLDLASKADFRVFPLLNPPRMVVDVFRDAPAADAVGALIIKVEQEKAAKRIVEADKASVQKEVPKPVAEAAPKPPKEEEPPPVAQKEKPKGKKLKIVVDPGHGGKDPGAIGPGGLKEKDVTLKMALEVKKRLLEKFDCEVLLTRDKDVELILARRTAIANTYGADLFISIHANASRTKSARGIETYYLDRTSDRSARRVAALENATSETGVLETEQILADVLLNMKLPESRRLAGDVQKEMLDRVVEEFGPVRDLGVKRAPFYVLTGAVMPAILLETAFISNKVEASWLNDVRFHSAVGDAVAAAISRYSTGP